MPEIQSCPACQRQVQVPEEYLGRQVKCPECEQVFTPRAIASGVQAEPPAPGRDAPGRGWADDEEYDDIGVRRRPDRPHRGGMILAFGILGVVLGICGIIFGPIAWFMGQADLAAMREGRMDRSGEGLTQAGRILGIVATILGALGLLYFVAMMLFFAASLG